ncbi:Beta-xylosidase [Cystobacter fuscus DSM 2262]|uniref:Beta-xylosidase n=1 Tax=Cystobacter fuscus (strain ATCC 25194 / DSM 2262 / NBRC 100088 / M29) TaxID=1242864 RepID=S9PJ03_CYSF2|nr:family 43 glycosylhydrolase [Cystobacter fuscus]EPX62397.1 Beta-xylosidase [Cystobacter fuscus DSM 2262]
MRSRGVSFSAALLSLSVSLTLAVTGCTQDTPKPPPVEPQPPVEPPPPPLPPLAVTNPVLSGDFADPSVIKVGEDYWASATSSEWAPQYPLLHSKDLLNWEQVGSIFTQQPSWSEANYWAPELAVDKGRYYVFYTAKKKGGPLCVAVATSAQPQGPYTDHGPLVCEELGSIDGALIRDENDELFLVWKLDGNSRGLPTPLWAQRLDVSGNEPKLVGDKTQILLNDTPWEGQLIEGPHLIKRNGWFYLFYAGAGCCGRECNYAVGVARSRKLLEGWEKNPLNPIMKNNESFKCPGHGSVVTDAQGRDYLLYHAYRTTDTVYVGRQGMLDVIQWGEDGWPTINSRRGPGGKVLTQLAPFSDEFTSQSLTLGWQWPNAFPPIPSLANGLLTLGVPTTDRADRPVGAILARATTTGAYAAEAVVDVTSVTDGVQAGLAAVGDWDNWIGVVLNGQKVEVWRRYESQQVAVTSVDAPAAADGKLTLRMKAKAGHLFQFSVRGEEGTWVDVGGTQDGGISYRKDGPILLPPWDRGVRVGLTAGGLPGASARFDSLRITPE